MRLNSTLRKHIITLIIVLYVIYSFVDTGLTRPYNQVEDARRGTPINCENKGTWYAAQYLAAPDVLGLCPE